MRETIHLGEGDSASVVRDKLERVRSKRVALVVPAGHSLLGSEVALTLIRRQAEALALDLVLVTNDRTGAALARGLGLKTTETVTGVRRGLQIGRGRRKRVELVRRASGGTVSTAARMSSAAVALPSWTRKTVLQRVKVPGDRLGQQIAILATGCLAVLVLVAGLALAVPSATVLLEPKGERASAQAAVVASTGVKQVDYERAAVPAHQVQIEVPGEEAGQTTGKRPAPDKHATGEAVFANKSTQEVIVPKGTVVRTADGREVKFYTLLDIRVPGSYGATARAPIMAFEPGPAGNVEALTIRVVEGEPSYAVEVLNDRATQGGSDQRVSVVASEDRDRLRASLVQKLQEEAYKQLVSRLAPGEWIPADSLDVVIADEVFDKNVDEEAEMLHLAMKVNVTGLVVEGEATQALMTRLLESRGGGGLVVNDATLQVRQPVGSASVDGSAVRFRATAEAMLVPAVDLRAVRSGVAGKDPEGAAAWLASQCDLRQPPVIETSPSWWRRLPWMPSRIRVRLAGEL